LWCSGLSHKLQVVRADFLDVPLPPFDALVANIPYQVRALAAAECPYGGPRGLRHGTTRGLRLTSPLTHALCALRPRPLPCPCIQISSPVLSRLFAHRPLPSRAVIMFQLEFAQRIVAPPGEAL
jgi:hypothetical protein